MNFTLTSKKLIGSPDPTGWVEIHDFTPVSEDTLSKKGKFITLISMLPLNGSSLSSVDSSIISREVLTRFHEDYYAKEGDTLKIIGDSVLDIQKNFSSPNSSLQIIMAIFINDILIVASFGQNEAWVLRNGVLAKLINAKNDLSLITGKVTNSDTFIFGTSPFFASVTPDLLKSSNILDTQNVNGSVAALEIKVSEKTPQMPVVVPNIPNIQKPPDPRPNLTTPLPHQISPIRLALAGVIDKILTFLPGEKGYIKEEIGTPEKNHKKVTTTAGAILFLLLLISIFFGIRQNQISSSRSKYEPILTSAQHNLDEAQGLISLDEGRARNLVLTAKNDIDNLKKQNIKDPRIAELSDKISESLGSIAGIYQQTPNLYLDLTLLDAKFKGDDLSVSDERMVVLDREGKRLESIDIGTSRADPVAGPDIMPNAISVASYSDRNFVSANDGIWEIGNQAKLSIKSEWSNNILITAYTGNIYVLDKNNSDIWRYQGVDGGWGSKQSWLTEGVKPDLANIVSWTIDGNMWLLSKSGDILRFSGGSPVDFSLKNMDKDPVAVDIATHEDSKYLYLLDKANSRVLVVDKDGNYKAQYLDSSIQNATKLVVSEIDKKIILLEGSKLYSLDIKHL